jgi:hypothetical protein
LPTAVAKIKLSPKVKIIRHAVLNAQVISWSDAIWHEGLESPLAFIAERPISEYVEVFSIARPLQEVRELLTQRYHCHDAESLLQWLWRKSIISTA